MTGFRGDQKPRPRAVVIAPGSRAAGDGGPAVDAYVCGYCSLGGGANCECALDGMRVGARRSVVTYKMEIRVGIFFQFTGNRILCL